MPKLDTRDMLLILMLCDLLGKPTRANEVEEVYSRVLQEAEEDVQRRYSQNE
jgi:hypothetical protein